MKPALLSSVSLWTLAVFCAVLEISQAECVKSACEGNVTGTSTTTTTAVTFGSIANCTISNGNKLSENGSIGGLIPGASYQIFFECFNCCKEATTKPLAVTNLIDTNITASSISLTWSKPEGNSSFYRVRWTDGDFNETTGASVTITGLTPGVKFSINVTAVADDRLTEGEKATLSLYTKPEVVSNITVTKITTSSTSLKWTKPEGNSSFYRVQWTDGNVTGSDNVTQTNITITKLTAGVQYEITVTAVADDARTDGQSTTVSQYTKPAGVGNLTVGGITTSSISLKWTKPEGNSSFYRVQWTDRTHNWGVSVAGTRINVTELRAGVLYSFSVIAVAGDNKTESDVSEIVHHTRPREIGEPSVSTNTSSISLNWTSPPGEVFKYRLEWHNGGALMTVQTSRTVSVLSGLIPGTSYNISVIAVAGDNKTEGNPHTFTSVTKPEVVSNITVTKITTSSISLKWTKPEGNSSFYRVQWTDGNVTGSDNVTQTNITITKLTAGVQYEITVTAVADEARTDGQSTTVSQYTKPAGVGNLTVGGITTSSISLKWTKPEGNSSFYRVQWTDRTHNWGVSVAGTRINVTELRAGVLYSFSVIAVAGDNKTESDVSEIVHHTRPREIGEPSVSTNTSSISLNWTSPPGEVFKYRLEWHNGGALMTVQTSRTVSVLSGLIPGTSYNISVIAVAGDNKTEGNPHTFTSVTKPEVVSNITVTKITTSSISLKWTKPEGNSSFYRVQWTDGNVTGSDNVTQTNITITKLTAGVQYEITVTAVADEARTDGQSTTVSQYTKPAGVGNLTVGGITTSSISLKWTKPEGNSSFYRVQWTDRTHNWGVSVAGTRINVTELRAGVLYSFSVIAVAGDNKTESDVSEIVHHTRPREIGEPSVSTNTSSISLNWTSPPGEVFKYRLEWHNGGALMTVQTSRTVSVLSGLIPGTSYNISVIAVAGDNKTEGNPHTFTSVTKPSVVRNLSIIDVTTSSVFLTWTEPEGNATSYTVQWSLRNDTFSNTTTETSFTINQLDPGVQYTVTVTAVAVYPSNKGEGILKRPFTRPREIGYPSGSTNTSSISLNWTSPPGEVFKYRLEWHNGGALMTVQTSRTVSVLSGLIPGTIYTISVIAVAGDNQTEGNPRTFISVTKPSVVRNLSIIDVTTSSVFLTWTEPEGNATSYTVQWSLRNDTFSNTTTETSFTINQLDPGVQYTVTVTAVAVYPSNKGEGILKRPFTRPEQPDYIMVTAQGTNYLDISWNLPGGRADHYVVNISNEGHINLYSNTTAVTTALFTDLNPGRLFFITVTAVAGSFTNTSDQSSFATEPTPPGSIIITSQRTDSLHLKWATPALMEGAPDTSYIITYQPEGGEVQNSSTWFNTTELSSLLSGTSYNITVETVGPQSLRSTAVHNSAFTLPKPVALLTVGDVNTTSIRLTWLRHIDHKPSYSYLVIALQDAMVVQNESTKTENYTFFHLTPGNLYTFHVFVVVAGVKSAVERIQSYTKPEAVSDVMAVGNTTTMSVSWTSAVGQVVSYTVLLYRDSYLVANGTDLSNTTVDQPFQGLTPGVLYCVAVLTKSGPFESRNSSVCNATFPNPPGTIEVASQTVTSINFTWASPKDMDHDQYIFYVFSFNGSFETGNNWFLLNNLQSGSPNNIFVVTVGVWSYESTAVTTEIYTRPYPVTMLRQTEISTNAVTLEWEPPENKSHYSYLVETTNGSFPQSEAVANQHKVITGLLSGSNYSFTVTTQTPDGTQSAPVTVSYFTRPYSIPQVESETLNTTAVQLFWMNPPEYKPEYTYRVLTTGCGSQNKTLAGEVAEMSELTPGTNCTFCVVVRAADGIEGKASCTSQYTKPEAVQPHLSNLGSNSSILVSWNQPPGKVEHYKVYLYSMSQALKEVQLNSNSTDFLFHNLSAGRLYTAEVTTCSGPFNASSGFITNATYPNPPGSISVLTKTTSSIDISWNEAPLMTGAILYQLTYLSPQGEENNSTSYTRHSFTSLLSGTSYNISIATVGAMGFKSEKVHINKVTTRPLSVNLLTVSPQDEGIAVMWDKPDDYQESYRYHLTWQSTDGPISDIYQLREHMYELDNLDPGKQYNISVTTETFDETQGAPRWDSTCTKASPPKNLECYGPNARNAEVILTCNMPNGQYSGFEVTVMDGESNTTHTCNHTVSNLRHDTQYFLNVATQSCGPPSTSVPLSCSTGITNPPIPENYESLVVVSNREYNKFTLQIETSLLNSINGPITHIGVLVTDAATGDLSDSNEYVGKTHQQWQEKDTPVYMATVVENTFLSRSGGVSHLNIEIGTKSQWMGYTNGALEANGRYQYAIVLFTSLDLQDDLVNGQKSLISITNFFPAVPLPQNPAVIGIAVGVTLGIFCVLIIILIGFIIYWKRLSNKESPDIQIQSMRAKVSVAVRVEEYAAYYKKQRADSNCGFAEEFEDLKLVGTAQVKTNAQTLENKPKNRYNNVLPYDSSRVKLSIIHGSPYDDYINANYMPGYNSRKEYIAAQGPLPTSVSEFWRMIWEKNVQTLVMLTRCIEQGRVKCEQYWDHGTKHFENINVTTTSETQLEDWTIRDFHIKNVKTAETRSVRHFHFTAWPDHGVPQSTELLISFRHLVREHMNQYSRHSPTVVHCSAGVGRTGTFIAIDRLIFQIERENFVDLYGIVHDLRMHRPLMVQTEDQYVFLNQCAMDIIRSRTGTNVDLIYQNSAALSIYENFDFFKSEYHDA